MGHKTRFVSRAAGADTNYYYYNYYTLAGGKGARVFCGWRRMREEPGEREEMPEPVASFECDAVKVEANVRARARIPQRFLIFDFILDCFYREMYAGSFSSVVRGAPRLRVDHDIGEPGTGFINTLVARIELFPASGTRDVTVKHRHFLAVPV